MGKYLLSALLSLFMNCALIAKLETQPSSRVTSYVTNFVLNINFVNSVISKKIFHLILQLTNSLI